VVEQTVPGQVILKQLQATVNQVRGEALRMASHGEALDKQVEEFVQRRGDALSKLAQHYLPDLEEKSIDKTYREIREDLEKVSQRRSARGRQLTDQHEKLVKAEAEVEVEIEELTKQLTSMVEKREELEHLLAEKLKADESFVQLSEHVKQTQILLDRNEERSEEIASEAKEKLPAYDDSEYFQYLYKRGFGTPEYKSRGITKSMDRFVAKLIGYSKAKSSYDFLRATPEMIRLEVDHRREELDEVVKEIDIIEQRYMKEIGLDVVLREGRRLGKARDAAITNLEQLQEDVAKATDELAAIAKSEGPFYDEAIERFSRYLGSLNTSLLDQRARKTPEYEDDEIVAEMTWLREESDKLKEQRRDLTDRYGELCQRANGIDYVVRRFHQAEFDSPRSVFPRSFSLDESIALFLEGTLIRESLWAKISRHQSFTPHWTTNAAESGGKILESPLTQVALHALLQIGAAIASQKIRNSGSNRKGSNRRGGGGFTGRGGF